MVFGMGYGLFEILFTVAFVAIAALFIVTAVRGLCQWHKNNNSPRLTVPATVVSKRTNITHHHNGNNVGPYRTSTTYYAAFQVESGDRMELQLDGSAYGLLAEGDKGKLTFQGTRFLGFERT